MTEYELPDGHTLHRWTNPTGDEWACMVYDHGPFCRLCQPVDETLHLGGCVLPGDHDGPCADEPPCGDSRPDPRTHPEFWNE